MSENETVESVFESHWKGLVCDDSGLLILERVKNELFDYYNMIDRMTIITCEVTGNVLSYPNYPAETILELFREHYINKGIAKDDMLMLVKESGDIDEILEEIDNYFDVDGN